MADAKIYLLPAPKFCGRGVRCRVLSAAQKDAARERAAASVPPVPKGHDATLADDQRFRVAMLRECILAMVVKVTKTAGLKSYDEILALPGSDWRTIDSEEYTQLFGADSKDDEFLQSIYIKSHSVSEAEVDDIMGKGLAVSED